MTTIDLTIVTAAVGLATLTALDFDRPPLNPATTVLASCMSSAASIVLSLGLMIF